MLDQTTRDYILDCWMSDLSGRRNPIAALLLKRLQDLQAQKNPDQLPDQGKTKSRKLYHESSKPTAMAIDCLPKPGGN